jgi:hypothetical protein
MSDPFHSAVLRIRAEQFFKEKAASARGGLNSVDYVLFVKSATELCKQAEPPPPDGVSVKEWDRILNKKPQQS